MNYKTVQMAFQNLELKKGRLSKNTVSGYSSALKRYLEFLNSREDQWTPDSLIEDCWQDDRGLRVADPKGVMEAQLKIVRFFQWLQGEEVDGYPVCPKTVRASTARQIAYSSIKGFYTNNGVLFPKTFSTPAVEEGLAIENDESVPFFTLDEKERELYFDRSTMKHFLSNLKLRDQAIALSLLSTSQDTGDLLRLTVGWARNQKDRSRFYWEGKRRKTHVPFKVFFSKEATDFVKKYLEQERKDTEDDEPLFAMVHYQETDEIDPKTRKNKVIKTFERLPPRQISRIFRQTAEKMGIKNGDRSQNPLRPKRLRHVFRAACTYSGVTEEGYIHVFMGHKSDISNRYLRKPVGVLELEYMKVESFLTVYEVADSEIQKELNRFKAEHVDLQKELGELKSQMQVFKKVLCSSVFPPNIYEKDGKVYEEVAVDIDMETGRYITETREADERTTDRYLHPEKYAK